VKLTPFAKVFIALIIVAVVGFVLWHQFGGKAKQWAADSGPGASGSATGSAEGLSKDDFKTLGGQKDADRKAPVTGIAPVTLGKGKIDRPLVVAINTWAGHAPGIVANAGLAANGAGSIYKDKYGLAVEFKIFEDPAAKLTAFASGQIDIMWDTVDSWAREASTLAEQKIKAKAIIQQDWSRGGDGIVSLKTIKSIEDLKGKKIATTRYTPSHWLLLYLLNQSGLTADDKKGIEKRDREQADPDPLRDGLGQDHGRLLLHARRPRRHDDRLRQHHPLDRGAHRQHWRRRREPRAVQGACGGGEEVPDHEFPRPGEPVQDRRLRPRQAHRAEHHRRGANGEPAHRDQGDPERGVMATW
jgi:ABC-type amino acid transport substrate-binding protein